MQACICEAYILSMSKSKSRVGWSSELRDDTELTLLTLTLLTLLILLILDVKEVSVESESLAERERKDAMEKSSRYFERQARLKEQSTSSNSSSSLRRSGMCGMITCSDNTMMSTSTKFSQVGWRLKMPKPCQEVHKTKGTHYSAHY